MYVDLRADSSNKAPRVLSYTRFSSRKQAKGLSYVRQIEAARQWCRENGYQLDESDQFNDFGVSAFSGANAETGALAELQQRLAAGEIERGTILIVEALDRLTRQALTKAITLLMSLATSGLTVVTLADRRVWNEESMNDMGSFVVSVVTLHRGHQESEYKSKRLQKTFKKHRETKSKQAFGSAPGWLTRVSKDAEWVVDMEKAAVVQKVFELAAAGFGHKAIAKKANEESWPVPTRLNLTVGRWHGQLPGIILRNRAVLGEHQHRLRSHEAHAQSWSGLPVGAPIPDYYPRIITDKLWNAAQASVRTRTQARRRDAHYYNVFSGLMFCGHCGAPIHRKNEKNGHSRAQLTCSDKLAGKTSCQTMSAKAADATILQLVYEYAYSRLGSERAKERGHAIAVLESQIQEKLEECGRIANAVAQSGGKVQAFIDKSIQLTDEVDELTEQLEDMKAEMEDSGSVFDEHFVDDALQYLYVSDDETAKERRAMLNLQLTRIVETIWLFSYDCVFVKFKDATAPVCMPLPSKQLPSRANPNAKHHKPPAPRAEPRKPVWESTMTNQPQVLPQPRRPVGFTKKARQFLLVADELEELDSLEQ